jgi:signal peptidase II
MADEQDQPATDPSVVQVPQVPPAAAPVPRARLFWWLSLTIIAVDQLTKVLVNNAVSLFETRTLIPGLVNLAHVRNEGVAFGLFNEFDLEHKWVFTTLLALGALAGITLYARHIRPEERLARIGLSLILGGAIGNLVDRVRQGYVLDFVDVYVGNWHFWAFNVADAAVSIGAVLVFVDLLFVRAHVPDPV